MRKLAILTAMGIALAAPVAYAAHWERLPNGALVCRGSYPGIGAHGQLIEVCPPDPISKEQADQYRREYNEREAAEEARLAESRKAEAAEHRAGIIAACTNPDPSINLAWCADEMAQLKQQGVAK
jgi:hypothetical protein